LEQFAFFSCGNKSNPTNLTGLAFILAALFLEPAGWQLAVFAGALLTTLTAVAEAEPDLPEQVLLQAAIFAGVEAVLSPQIFLQASFCAGVQVACAWMSLLKAMAVITKSANSKFFIIKIYSFPQNR
jgi:hypothetical protein